MAASTPLLSRGTLIKQGAEAVRNGSHSLQGVSHTLTTESLCSAISISGTNDILPWLFLFLLSCLSYTSHLETPLHQDLSTPYT